MSYVSAANLAAPVIKFRALNLKTWTFRMSLLVWIFFMGKENKQENPLTYLHKLLCCLPKILPTNTLPWLESV